MGAVFRVPVYSPIFIIAKTSPPVKDNLCAATPKIYGGGSPFRGVLIGESQLAKLGDSDRVPYRVSSSQSAYQKW
jgi:hypothetical protein